MCLLAPALLLLWYTHTLKRAGVHAARCRLTLPGARNHAWFSLLTLVPPLFPPTPCRCWSSSAKPLSALTSLQALCRAPAHSARSMAGDRPCRRSGARGQLSQPWSFDCT